MQGIVDWLRESVTEFGVAKVYIGCAVIGGGLLLFQIGLNVIGLGGDVEDADVGDTDFDDIDDGGLNILSLRAIAGFLTFFGLVGWAGLNAGWGNGWSALAGFAAGASVMLLVAYVMRFFKRLTISGTADPMRGVGSIASVYLRIPAKRAGKGKITVSIDGRSLEFPAVTPGDEIPTGAQCKIVSMPTPNTYEVVALD